MSGRECIGVLILSTSPDVSYIYTNLTLQKELSIRNTFYRFLLSSLHPHNSSEVSRNSYSLVPSLAFRPLAPFLSSFAILCNPDTAARFLTMIVRH